MILEVLISVATPRFFAKLSDGSYRWLTDDLRLQDGGPHSAWVERGRTTKAASWYGEMSIQPLMCQEIMVRNANLVNGFLETANA